MLLRIRQWATRSITETKGNLPKDLLHTEREEKPGASSPTATTPRWFGLVGLNDVQRKCDGQKHLLVFRRNSSNPATTQRDSDAGRVLRVTNSSFIWVLGHIFAFNPCGFLLIHRYRDQSIHNKCLNMQVYLSFTSGFKKSILKGVYWSWSIKAISSFYLVLVTWHRVIKASDIPQECLCYAAVVFQTFHQKHQKPFQRNETKVKVSFPAEIHQGWKL